MNCAVEMGRPIIRARVCVSFGDDWDGLMEVGGGRVLVKGAAEF